METKYIGLRDYDFKDRLFNVADATSYRGEQQFHERLSESSLRFDCA